MQGLKKILLCFIFMSGLFYASPVLPQDELELRVATKLFPPFVVELDDEFTGFSIQLWDAIAQEMGVSYELYEVESVVDQLNAVQDGSADVAVAGISITLEREETVDFSFPFFDAGLQILIPKESQSSVTNIINALLSPMFIQFLLTVLVLILVASHILWLFERRHNPTSPQSYRASIGQSLWWSTVTVLGFDDQPPNTVGGKLMGIVWMFAGIFIIANLTATLSANAAVQVLRGEINAVDDLRDHRVVTIEGTTSARYLGTNGISFIGVQTIEQAYEMLREGQAEAMVYDAPILRHFLNTDGRNDFQLVGQVFEPEKYGIALPVDSPYRESINQAILGYQEDGTYQQLYTRWFGGY
jgi:polar amino acid transport system substrate-binding protein